MTRLLTQPKTLFLAILLLAGALVGGAGSALALDAGPWLVTEVAGEARLASVGGAPRALRVGDEVAPGYAVETGADGRAILTRDGTSMTLSANGRLEIPTTHQNGVRTTVFQRLGTVLLNVDKRPEQHFQVDTPYLAAVVKGTTFTVNVGAAGAEVHLVEGAVEVGAFGSGEVALLRPGQTALVGIDASAPLKVMEGQSSGAAPAQRDQQGQARSGSDETTQAAEPAATKGEDGSGSAVAKGTRNDDGTASLAAITGESRAGDNAGAKIGLPAPDKAEGLGKGPRITATLGETSINIASVTDGLVAPAVPVGGRLVTGPETAAGSDKAAGNDGRGSSATALHNAPGQHRAAATDVGQSAGNVFTVGVVDSAAAGVSSVTNSVADVGAVAGSSASGGIAGDIGSAATGASNGLGNIVGDALGDAGNGNGNRNGALVGVLNGDNGSGNGLGLGNLLNDKPKD